MYDKKKEQVKKHMKLDLKTHLRENMYLRKETLVCNLEG